MTAMRAAGYYAAGCAWCVLACAVTFASTRPDRWVELAAAYAVVWPLLGAWRRAA